MVDPAHIVADPERGPRAEVVLRLHGPGGDRKRGEAGRGGSPPWVRPVSGLARSLAVVAATPAVEGVILAPDALIDLGSPLWARPSGGAPFTTVLLGRSEIVDLPLESPREPVQFLSATPITATEAAWVRLKGADAMREAWLADGVDVLDPNRRAAQPR
jgi:Suppressor of fused protein (SUFU)